MSGEKTIETRKYYEEALLGTYVGLVVGYSGNTKDCEGKTGRKIMPAIVKINEEPVLYGSKEAFQGDYSKHKVYIE